jgi:L-2-hydroxyglutarate oxidase LhgO
MTTQTDVAIVGGGIIGLATAYRLLERFLGTKVTILEKEASLAFHQTGRNSGVLHSGIYYKPGLLRATNCREGSVSMPNCGLPRSRFGLLSAGLLE